MKAVIKNMIKNDRKYTCVMFDLDGTLLDSLEDMQNAVNLTMDEFGCPRHSLEDIRSYINDGSYMLIKRALPESIRNNDQEVKKIHARYLETYLENVNIKTHIYDGTKELAKRLKSEGYTLAVVSNKPDSCTKELIKYFYGDVFDYVSGSGLGLPTKPDRRCVDIAVEKTGADINRLIYVGDSHVDVQTAHNAGVPCVGVTWGFHGANGFGEYKPDFYADNIEQLYAIITSDKA